MDIGSSVSIGLRVAYVPLCIFGFGVFVVNKYGFATRDNIRALAQFFVNVFAPVALLLTHGGGLSWKFFVDSGWKLPVFHIAALAISFACGRLVASFVGSPPWFVAWFTMANTFASSLAIPLMMMRGVCSEVFWETDKQCFELAMVRVLLYVVPLDFILFTAGRVYVQRHAQKFPAPSNGEAPKAGTSEHRTSQPVPIGSGQNEIVKVEGVTVELEVEAKRESFCRSSLKQLWSPVIVGEVVGMVIGLTPIQKLFFGSDPPLAFLMSPLKVLDGTLVPISNLIPALNLGHKVRDLWNGKETDLVKTWWKPILALLLLRSVVMPAILISLLVLAMDVDLVSASDDRIFKLVLFMETASPTAPILLILASSMGHLQAAEVMALALVPQVFLFIPLSAFVVSLAVRMTA